MYDGSNALQRIYDGSNALWQCMMAIMALSMLSKHIYDGSNALRKCMMAAMLFISVWWQQCSPKLYDGSYAHRKYPRCYIHPWCRYFISIITIITWDIITQETRFISAFMSGRMCSTMMKKKNEGTEVLRTSAYLQPMTFCCERKEITQQCQ